MELAKSFWRILGVTEKEEQRWIIASNRLPFQYNPNTDTLDRSSGGLITAISGIHSSNEIIWIGGAPDGMEKLTQKNLLPSLEKMRFQPIFIDSERYSRYYNGMCNNALWPLLHYESNLVSFQKEDWLAYCEVNEMFANEILKTAKPGDLVWIHDFHLFLVGQQIKALNQDLKVGLFLHTPFPSAEIFRQLPMRKEILQALTACDLVGFHDYSYLRHFTSAVQQVLGLQPNLLSINNNGHVVSLGVFPVSIDTPAMINAASTSEVTQAVDKFWRETSSEQIILGVDRLDYIKGLKLKLRTFQELLQTTPELIGKVCLLQIAVPTRTEVPGYIEFRKEVEQLVGEINGAYSKPNFIPVHYIFGAVSALELLALYRLADVLLVSSRRDGMNLVALEYIAAQDQSDPGVVVLSEFTGAVSTLSHSIPINPWDVEGSAKKLKFALNMDIAERTKRHHAMIHYLENYTATDWAQSFVRALERGAIKISDDKVEPLYTTNDFNSLLNRVFQAQAKKSALIFLDNDGTLMPFVDTPSDSFLDPAVKKTLIRLGANPFLRVVLLSGRNKEFLQREFGEINLELAAEHGAFFFDHSKQDWTTLVQNAPGEWLTLVRQVMEDYTVRVPDSFVEEKQFSLVWHYRRSPHEFSDYQAFRLKQDLDQVLANYPASVLFGNKAVEVRSLEASKRAFVHWYLQNNANFVSENVILGVGDDATDEEMFQAISAQGGISIKVGTESTLANFRIVSQDRVPLFLETLDSTTLILNSNTTP